MSEENEVKSSKTDICRDDKDKNGNSDRDSKDKSDSSYSDYRDDDNDKDAKILRYSLYAAVYSVFFSIFLILYSMLLLAKITISLPFGLIITMAPASVLIGGVHKHMTGPSKAEWIKKKYLALCVNFNDLQY